MFVVLCATQGCPTFSVQDDLAIMIEGNDSQYYFQGGAVCVPGFWRMRDKIGRPLDEIHTSGNVPYCKSNTRCL